MARGVVSILLMILSLEALLLVAGRTISAAAVSGTIRLPSDVRGVADLVTAMATTRHGNEERPWECCDYAVCARTWPPKCQCTDITDHCSDACKDCEELEGSRYRCKDWYRGEPGPMCGYEDDGNSRDTNIVRLPDGIELGPERVAVVRGARKKGQERPWKCCDEAVLGPTTEGTVWYCKDKVEKCTCESCFKLKDSHSYYCLDGYQGSDPGPTCSHA